MTGLTSISLSLATYKAIEAQRLSFTETHEAIIRRALSERTGKRSQIARHAALAARGSPRRRGRVRVRVFGVERDAINLRDAYLVILTELTRHKASLLHLLANEGSAQRRWVAPTAEALFVTAPHLAIEHAHQIAPNWFVDTNLSRAQILRRLSVACTLVGCRYPEDIALIDG